MKRIIFLMAILTGLVLLMMGTGCDSSKDPVSNQQGDTTAANFQFVDSAFGEDIFSSFDISLNMSLALLDEIEGITMSPSKSTPLAALGDGSDEIEITLVDSFLFTPEYWYVFIFHGTIIDGFDTININGIDSIQLLNDGTPLTMEIMPLVFNGVKVRAHVNGETNNGTTIGSHHRVDFEVNVTDTDSVATIDGTAHDTIAIAWADDVTTCELEMASVTTVDGLELLLNGGDDCPLDGTISVTMAIDMDCTGDSPIGWDQLNIDGTWTMTAVVNGNRTITVTISDGTTTWTTTETLDCGPSA
ncbi:MAG: hypothetical protein KOO62_05345 [candidate division Zixibacteria bacterium]|nr:hypothetical protein [candidate division Zixibacteria bacterium]